MNVYLYQNNTEKILKNIYIGEYKWTVQTFDFQNNWSLNWTAVSVYWQPNYVTWEWWTIWTSYTALYQSAIKPPTSVFGGTLKKIKIWMYKWIVWSSYPPDNHAVGAWMSSINSSLNPCVLYWTNQWSWWINLYDGSNHVTTWVDITWEITQEYIMEDNGNLTFIINWTYTYNLWNYATIFKDIWDNQTFGIWIGRWRANNGDIYVRKVEITTIE